MFNNLLISHIQCFQFFNIINNTENNFLYMNTCTHLLFLEELCKNEITGSKDMNILKTFILQCQKYFPKKKFPHGL